MLIVEDQPIFAETLRLFLDRDERIEIVGVATNGADAIELAMHNHADVVLMDIAMPVMDGIAATQTITSEAPKTRVIVLTGSEAPHDVSRARAAGAAGYVTKDQIAGDSVRDEVRRAGAVGLILKGSVANELVDEILAAAGASGPTFL